MLLSQLLKGHFTKRKTPVVKSYTSNIALQTIMNDWSGTPLDNDGLFINPEYPTVISFRAILRFLTQRNPQGLQKKHDKWRIEVCKNDEWLLGSSDKIVWLGHASFFIQLSGIRILIDPIFGNLPIGKRYSVFPVNPEKLVSIDYILISHAHYDHCDKSSIKRLCVSNPKAQILCGLKLNEVLKQWTNNPIQSAGWYQQYKLPDNLSITFLPSRHWANRNLFDINKTLWGGFMIQLAGKSIYYSGDSGHGSHFKTIGEVFPGINIALIGSGAYSPAWFMGPHHQDPFNAVKAFHSTGAKTFIPFHYGTFNAADEPMGEPETVLKNMHAEGKINNELKILKLGEPFNI